MTIKKTKPHSHPTLDAYEQDLENNLDKSPLLSQKEKTNELKKLQSAASNYSRKDKRITIRIGSSDLSRLKQIAIEEGLPYQTFISSMLHKISTGRIARYSRSK